MGGFLRNVHAVFNVVHRSHGPFRFTQVADLESVRCLIVKVQFTATIYAMFSGVPIRQY